MTGEPCSASVVATAPLEAWFIDGEGFLETVERCPGLWRNLVRILSQRLVRTTRRLAEHPSNKMVVLVMACAPEEESALALVVAGSVAQTDRPPDTACGLPSAAGPPAGGDCPAAMAPPLNELVADRTLLGQYDSPLEPTTA